MRKLLFSVVFLLASCGGKGPGTDDLLGSHSALLLISEGQLYDFGTQAVHSSVHKTFTVTNTGKLPATEMTGSFYLSLSFNFKGGSYPGSGGSCSSSLAPDASCTIVITFTPKYAGKIESAVMLTYFNGFSTVSTSEPVLTGVGTE